MNRYAAKFLFQFRVVVSGKSSKRRICEEKIILIFAQSAENALKMAQKIGKKSEHNYLNDEGNLVFYEFVGVLDLMHLGIECDKNEVWYEIKECLMPMERKERLIPNEDQLSAIRNERR